MLSSTLVTVLAPQWNSRLTRGKAFDGNGCSEAQGDIQHVPETIRNHFSETWGQNGVRTDMSDIPQSDKRTNKIGWSSKSDPSSLDFKPKKEVTVSLDSDSTSYSPTSPSLHSSLFQNSNDFRKPQISPQGRISSLSAKPTTSSLLLAFRRNNSDGTNHNQISFFPNANHKSPNSPSNDNRQDRHRPLSSPSSVSNRTNAVFSSPSPSDGEERNISNKFLFPTSTNRDVTDNTMTHNPQQASVTQTGLKYSSHSFQSKRQSERKQGFLSSENTNHPSETSINLPRYTPYSHSALGKSHSLPKRTNLTSSSWWKQVSQEVGTPLSVNDTANKTNKLTTDAQNKRLGIQALNNKENNNMSGSICKDNINLSLTTQYPESKKLAKWKQGLNLNNGGSQKPQNTPECLTSFKYGQIQAQDAVSPVKKPSKDEVITTSVNEPELASTLLSPKTSNPPTESSSKYCSLFKTTNISTSTHNIEKLQMEKSPQNYPTSVQSRALSNTTSDISSVPSTKGTFSSQSNPASSKTSSQVLSAQATKYISKSNTTPLGFERSYVCLPKPYRSKTVSNLFPTVNSSFKTKASPTFPVSTLHSTNSPSSPSSLSPSVTPATSPISIGASSLPTPPSTPMSTSPSSQPSTPKLKSIFHNSTVHGPKKPSPRGEGKRERRVTWDDSVDEQCSVPASAEKLSQSQTKPSKSSTTSASSPIQSSSPKAETLNMQVGNAVRCGSMSSECAGFATGEGDQKEKGATNNLISDQSKQGSNTRQTQILSLESDFSNGFKLRYSTPPYSTLMSNRKVQEELKTSQQSLSIQTPQPIQTSDSCARSASPTMTSQSFSLPLQRPNSIHTCSVGDILESDKVNNNHIKDRNQDQFTSSVQLLNNRIQISSESFSDDEKDSDFSSTCVTETLVYSIKPKLDQTTCGPKKTTPQSVQHNTNTVVTVETFIQPSDSVPSEEAKKLLCTRSDHILDDSRLTKSSACDKESKNTNMKAYILGKSRFYSEVNNEQISKRSQFALKKSIGTPSSGLPQTETERVIKHYNKVDQMFSKLKQKFCPKRTDEDLELPPKLKQTCQTPSGSGSSDVGNIDDITGDSTKTLKDQGQRKVLILKETTLKTNDAKGGVENKSKIVPVSTHVETKTDIELPKWLKNTVQENVPKEQNGCIEKTSETKVETRVQSPLKQRDLSENKKQTTSNLVLPCLDSSVDSPMPSHDSQYRKSTPSPRSPFSPFSSLSPVSTYSSPDGLDDSVFYSPKLQRRRECFSPFEPGDGICLGSSRRGRASTGPPTPSPVQDKDHSTSAYADLKYGIEPGRSYSVSSVLSCRPSGPRRISTGSRFMSVGDLSQSALSCSGSGKELCQFSDTPDWMKRFRSTHSNDKRLPNDAGKLRSRSLPRSLTRCLTNWSSGVPPSEPKTLTASKSASPHSPDLNIFHFSWDTEGPPTPPLTPPLSPVTRRMSKPPPLPNSPVSVQQPDSPITRGRLPSRGYTSNLGTFDEFSDSSSDTTTDDEYYIESDEDGDKETEL